MRVTSKGQVTIPQDIRRRLGIEPGTEVDFVITGDDVRVVRRAQGAGTEMVKRMRGRRLSMTTDEITALTRGDA